MRPPYRGFTGAHCNPLVCGRRHCTVCGRWRHGTDFPCSRRRPRLLLAGRCATCARRQGRQARRDPVRGELRREYDRIWHEGRRRAKGIPERPGRTAPPDPPHSPGNRTLPAAPLHAPLHAWMRAYAVEHPSGVNGSLHGIRALARASGVEERLVYNILSGRQERCHYAVADRLLIAVGLSLTLVYGEA